MRPRLITAVLLCVVLTYTGTRLSAEKLLIPMDLEQTDHLKAYGVAYWILRSGGNVEWLLNYRGGSFLTDYGGALAAECRLRDVAFLRVTGAQAAHAVEAIGDAARHLERNVSPRLALEGLMLALPRPGAASPDGATERR